MSTTENSINNSVQTKKANTNINNGMRGGWGVTYLGDRETICEIFLVLDHGLPGPRAQLTLGLRVDADVALAAPTCGAAVAGK